MEHLCYEARDGVARLTLDRPDIRNALSFELVQDLLRRIAEAASDTSVRLLLLRSEGPAFCAGMDLKSIDLGDSGQASGFARAVSDLYYALLTLPKPFLCAVDGPVSGGGVGLPAAADLVWAGPRASFALPETRLGLVPALVSVVVRRRVGDGTLKRMALGGISLDAERAVEHGLADFLAEGSASETADEFARELLRDHAPGALARTKRFLSRRAGAGLEAELSEARREFEDAVGSDEARRGLDAFRRKESVRWDGA